MSQDTETKVARFATRMHRIPRKATRCSVYGTVRAIVDERHARNILLKIDPCAKGPDIYTAICIMQERLDA